MKYYFLLIITSYLVIIYGCSNQNNVPKLSMEQIRNLPDSTIEDIVHDIIISNFNQDDWNDEEILPLLSKGQQAFYITTDVEGEVSNGGFNQYYHNSSGKWADKAVESFELFGGVKHAELMSRANDIYKKIKPELDKLHDGSIESFSKSYKDNPLNKLDDEFYVLTEPLQEMRIKYIRNHPEEFVKKYNFIKCEVTKYKPHNQSQKTSQLPKLTSHRPN